MTALARDRRGATTILVAGALAGLCGLAALAVDAGSAYLDSRRLQGIADAAALSAATEPARADAAARAIVTANRLDMAVAVAVATGRYARDAAVPVAGRFMAGTPRPDAARVTLTAQVPLWFARIVTGRRSMTVVRRATAMRAPQAAFSIGTRVASLAGGVANALTSRLIGGTVALDAIDYRRLIDTDVSIPAVVAALREVQGLGSATYATVLATQTTVPVYLRAVAIALDGAGNAQAAAAMRALAAGAAARPLLPSTLIDPGALAHQTKVTAAVAVSAWDVAQAAIGLGGGKRQVSADLGLAVPGLLGTKLWVAVGERAASSPWLAVTASGTPVVRTTQTRVYLETSLGIAGLTGIASLKLPLYADMGAATAALSAIDCDAVPATATLAVTPALGHVGLTTVDTTKLDDFNAALAEPGVTMATATLLSIHARAGVDFSATAPQSLVFTRGDVTAGTIRTVRSVQPLGGIVASLLSNATITPSILGIGLGLTTAGVTALVRPVLVAATAPLDGLLGQVLGLLGLHLGEADVRVNGLRCGQPMLVA